MNKPLNFDAPNATVCTSEEVSTTEERGNSFQIPKKQMIKLVTRAGLITGTLIRKRIPIAPQPSMVAASSRVDGIDRKAATIISVCIGAVHPQ